MQTPLPRRSYDYRIREAICESRDPDLFPELNIPNSTIRSWLHRGIPDVVTADLVGRDHAELLAENRELHRRVALLGAIVRVFVALVRVSKTRLVFDRIPEGGSKRVLLRAIESSKKVMPLTAVLRIVGISPSRYHSWCRAAEGCDLADQPSCPKAVPARLTSEEVETIGGMVASHDYRFMSIRSLALHAQRIGRVFASPSTWYALVRRKGWRRPRKRLYPAKPKVGARAVAPGELVHLDVTIIKLLDGTRTYLHAIIDNYSRRILSWTLESRLGCGATCRVLRDAAKDIVGNIGRTLVVTDAGSENVNRDVDDELSGANLERVLAQIDVTYSNSMIEAFWRSLKNSWLYLHGLESESRLRRLIAFYVQAHNAVMPHSAFNGQTPDEVYFGTGDTVAAELAIGRARAREARMDQNRQARCGACVARAG
jgi:transposase InsO family protein